MGWCMRTRPPPPRRRAPRRRRRTAARAGRARGSRGRSVLVREQLLVRAARGDRGPPSRTTISSASAIVERRWAMISVVRPLITSRRPAADLRLRRRVDRCGRVVEDEDARVDREGPRDRDPLPLPARERDAALADDGVVALRQPLDELVRLREPRHALDLARRSVRGGRTRCCPAPSSRRGTDPGR